MIIICSYTVLKCTTLWAPALVRAGYHYEPSADRWVADPTPEAKRLQARIALDFINTALGARS